MVTILNSYGEIMNPASEEYETVRRNYNPQLEAERARVVERLVKWGNDMKLLPRPVLTIEEIVGERK